MVFVVVVYVFTTLAQTKFSFSRKINASITLLILKYDTDLKLKSIVLKNVLFLLLE